MARSRSINNALARLLASSPRPIYVLDDERKIIYANAAFFSWTGTDEEQLIGTRCDYHSNPEVGPAAEIAAQLCPPPEVFRGHRMTRKVSCRVASGELSHREADFQPLGDDDSDVVGVIVTIANSDLPTSSNAPKEPAVATPGELHQQLLELRQQIVPRYGIDRLAGDGPLIRRVREQVRFAHESRARTVIFGPPGSGREHIARTIHYGDHPQAAGRLVPVSCSLMDAELLQATITNVLHHRDEGSRTATLLLLDVDELPDVAQYELAGFFTLPGFDLHTLSTARDDLLTLVNAGAFRKDLAAALSTMVIHIPPLAERLDDIPALAQAFLEEFNATGGHQLSGFSPEALDQLANYHWPNNVDELMQMVHDACAHTEGILVNTWDLPQRIRFAADAAAHPHREEETIVLDEFLAEIERELIERAMKRAKGNKTKASQLLGVTRARLHRRLAQLGWDAQLDSNDDE